MDRPFLAGLKQRAGRPERDARRAVAEWTPPAAKQRAERPEWDAGTSVFRRRLGGGPGAPERGGT